MQYPEPKWTVCKGPGEGLFPGRVAAAAAGVIGGVSSLHCDGRNPALNQWTIRKWTPPLRA